MKRRTPPTYLTEAFREEAFRRFTHCGPGEGSTIPLRLSDGGPACWLKQFDPLDRPCSGDLEAIHLIGRQRIRNVLRPLLMTPLYADGAILEEDVDDLVELAEWDPRLGAPGCTGHHRRFDSHATPELRVPLVRLFDAALPCFLDWGLESEAERKFLDGNQLDELCRHRAVVLARQWGRPDFLSDEAGAAAGLQQQPPLVGAGAGAPRTASAGSGEIETDSAP